jgi:hypothetical protein
MGAHAEIAALSKVRQETISLTPAWLQSKFKVNLASRKKSFLKNHREKKISYNFFDEE